MWKALCLAVAALAGIAPLRAEPPPIHRIVAVGDLHGDFAAWRAIARAAGLIDAGGAWAGGATVFVQTGDAVDRGPDSRRIVEDLMRLQREAPRAGGRVIALVGNHEAMNVTDDLRYVSPGDFAAFADAGSAKLRETTFRANQPAIAAAYRKRDPSITDAGIHDAWIVATPLGQIEHQIAWHPDGSIGRWVAANPAVALLDGTLFVHGGISANFAKLSVAEINARVDAALAARETADTSIINAADGPLWYRGLVARENDHGDVVQGAPDERELTEVLKAYGATRIVVAHTPILSGIAVLDEGRLVRIDTGISAVYGGTPSYLEIIDGRLAPHAVARPSARGPE